MKLYNSLTRKLEAVEPLEKGKVRVYACGPTVYFYPQIGNWRTFTLGDLLVRTLQYVGYEVNYLMNITDVGHLTGDNMGDASSGEDRLEKGAKREGKTAWDVAEFYTQDFLGGYEKLNLSWPRDKNFCKATEHIPEQIELIKKIEEKGFTYKIGDGIYFDVGAYEKAGNEYGLMSNIHIDEGQARIAENEEKKDKRDFALWKFSYPGGRDFDAERDDEVEKRQMEWESPWGIGFPGWHIECSAMSMKYLGEQFDIHVGGEDHKSTHHPNEIAQSEAASGKKPYVKYWVHGAFLQVDGGRMGKSRGNAYTLADVESRGYSPMDLRYFYLTGHYRKPLNFTWDALEGARKALTKLKDQMMKMGIKNKESGSTSSEQVRIKEDEKSGLAEQYREKFREAVEKDLNMPEALAVVWGVMGDGGLADGVKLELVREFDGVLGLELVTRNKKQVTRIPKVVIDLVKVRENMRAEKRWEEADGVREEIEGLGWVVEDGEEGSGVSRRN